MLSEPAAAEILDSPQARGYNASVGSAPVLHLRQGTRIYGPERQIIQLAEWLPRLGYRVDALVWQRHAGQQADAALVDAVRRCGGQAEQVDASWLALPQTARHIARRIDRTAYALVHTHEYKTTIIGGAIARRCGVRWLTSDHGLYTTGSLFLRLYRALEVMALRHATCVIVPSEAQRRQLHMEGVPLDRIVVIPHGLSLDGVRMLTAAERSHLRRSLAAEDTTALLLAVGRLEHVKGHRFLLDALPALLQKHPQAQLWIVGEGSLRQPLERQVATLGLSRAVRFLGYRADVFDLMQAADIFVMPSLSETFGMAALEAMALARPVVASDVGGLAEVVVHRQTGWLVPPASPPAWADALLSVLDQPDLLARLGQQGQERARTEYTVERMATRMRDLYDEVVACPSPPYSS